jgi:hypothetical protein
MSKHDYSRNLVKVPKREVAAGLGIKGRTNPTLTYMSNELVPGSNVYIEWGWIWEMPEPNPHIFEHSHNKYNEIVLHIGADPFNPEYLGADIEFVVGNDKLTIDKSSALFVPKGVKHGPLTWRKLEKPHLQIAMVLGAGSLMEANPGGHE